MSGWASPLQFAARHWLEVPLLVQYCNTTHFISVTASTPLLKTVTWNIGALGSTYLFLCLDFWPSLLISIDIISSTDQAACLCCAPRPIVPSKPH